MLRRSARLLHKARPDYVGGNSEPHFKYILRVNTSKEDEKLLEFEADSFIVGQGKNGPDLPLARVLFSFVPNGYQSSLYLYGMYNAMQSPSVFQHAPGYDRALYKQVLKSPTQRTIFTGSACALLLAALEIGIKRKWIPKRATMSLDVSGNLESANGPAVNTFEYLDQRKLIQYYTTLGFHIAPDNNNNNDYMQRYNNALEELQQYSPLTDTIVHKIEQQYQIIFTSVPMQGTITTIIQALQKYCPQHLDINSFQVLYQNMIT